MIFFKRFLDQKKIRKNAEERKPLNKMGIVCFNELSQILFLSSVSDKVAVFSEGVMLM